MVESKLDILAVFTVAAACRTAEERAKYLDEVCESEPHARARVETLLRAHSDAGNFLGGDSPEATPTINQPLAEKPGDTIGPYKLLEQIGEGGMGTVYMAEQNEPVQRRVALKVIKPGMDSRAVISRFEAERQALALMDHPNIARVLDAGTTDSGRPYFVMELVKGIPVTQYCDEQHLSPRERLELFVPICQAVQHAHQKGIIHRDLKPSNILIAQYDDKPVPKVIDFGVAKAISQRLTEQTVFTQYGQIVGTLEYMSPEQAQFNQLDVDTRSDVYSLGVLLYELLTGETPFDKTRLRSAAFDELLRIIREEEPPKPSTRLSTAEGRASSAANRSMEPAKLSGLIRGELDWIVMKALEKDRNRRYETASSLAADVQHYLHDEAVVACPPSAAYRFRKFARRNKVAIATTAAIALALITAVVGTSWQAYRATKAEREAVAFAEDAKKQAERANNQAAIAQAVNDFLNEDLLAQADPESDPERDITLRAVVDRAAGKVEGRFTEQPLVEAAIQRTLGWTYLHLGEYAKAEQHFRRAREIRQGELGTEHAATWTVTLGMANAINKQGRHAEAETLCRNVSEVRQRVLGKNHPATLQSKMTLANAILKQGRHAEAEGLYREVIEIQNRVLGPEHHDALASKMNLANAIGSQGRNSEAETLYREVLSLDDREYGSDHPRTLQSKMSLANAISKQGRSAEAEKLLREVLQVQDRVLGSDHPQTLLTKLNLAVAISRQGRKAEAEQLYREVLQVQERVLGSEHPNTLTTKLNLVGVISRQPRNAEAEQLCVEVVEGRRRVLGPSNPDTWSAEKVLANIFSNSAWQLATAEKFAERNTEKAVELAQKAIELEPENANHWNNLGVAQYRAGDWQAAVDAFQKADVLIGGTGDRAHRFFLAMAFWQLGNQTQAREAYSQAIEWLKEQPRKDAQHRLRKEADQLLGITPFLIPPEEQSRSEIPEEKETESGPRESEAAEGKSPES